MPKRSSATTSTALPKITPVRFVERAAPFDDPKYVFELKYDGFRALAYIEHGTVRLVSRKGNTYTRFDELCNGLLTTLNVQDGILDGEIVCLDDEGKPRFDWLLHRRHVPSFVAFDLLWLNGIDWRGKPLLERKTALRKIIPKDSQWVLYADHVADHGVALFQEARERDLEGIVGKQKDEPYRSNVRWVKIKNPGYSQRVGRQEEFQRKRTR